MLDEYLNKKMLLETPSKQSRLLNEVPEVIAAIEKYDRILEYSPSEDKQGDNGCSESAPKESPTPSTGLANETSCCPNGRTDPAGSQVSQENRDVEVTAAKHRRKQTPSNFEQSSSMDDKSWTKKVPTIDNLRLFPCIPADETTELVEDKGGQLQTVNCQSICEDKAVQLSHDEDEDELVSIEAPALEIPGSDLWYCISRLGEMRGPYKMPLLKQRNALRESELSGYMVWKEGQSKDMAIFLSDVIRQTSLMPPN